MKEKYFAGNCFGDPKSVHWLRIFVGVLPSRESVQIQHVRRASEFFSIHVRPDCVLPVPRIDVLLQSPAAAS